MINMHKRSVKIILLSMTAALAFTGVGAVAYAAGASEGTSESTSANTTESASVSGKSAARTSEKTESSAVGKDETVYVLAGADGSAKKVIVSEWLKNPDGAARLNDRTALADIENTGGDEGYTISSDNMQVWDANGNDIYYQGTTNQALPVGVSVSYFLDGQPVSAQELAGKSGRVTMRFTYQNNQKETVTVGGSDEEMYVPFVMVTGMILDTSRFTNISVSNGKIVSDGDKAVVMGFALPRMQENLGLSAEELELPSSVEISADVTDFELTTTLTLATNELFNELNLDGNESLSELSDSLSQLTDASAALVDGSSELYSGLETLLGKSGELTNGIAALKSGAQELSAGAEKLKDGAGTLNGGIISLDEGLAALDTNSATLAAGARQVFDTLLAQANTQLAASGLSVPQLTVENYKETLSGIAASVSPEAVRQMAENTAREKVKAAVSAQEATIRSGVTEAVSAQVLSGVLEGAGLKMSAEEYAAAQKSGSLPAETAEAVNAAVSEKLASEETQAQIETLVSQKIDELVDSNMQASDIQAQIDAAVSTASSGSGSLTALIESLDSYNAFYQGLLAYTGGVSQAASGADALKSGANTLVSGIGTLGDGANALYTGINSLSDGSEALIDGVTELRDGSMQLSDGMKRLNDEGIEKLAGMMDKDGGSLIDRLTAMTELSRRYQSFGGIADDTKGSVKFIFRTDEISAEDEE